MVWNSLQTFPEALLGFSGLDSKPKILHVLFTLACHISNHFSYGQDILR